MEKSTIVLDMDNSLLENVLYRKDFPFPFSSLITHRNKDSADHFFLSPREGVEEFLSSLPSRFSQIIIWSAGTCNYVESTCYDLFNKVGYIPTAILTRDDCEFKDGKYLKPLKKILKEYRGDRSCTFLVDDSPSIFEGNDEYLENVIRIPRFFIKNGQDEVMKKLTQWVLSLPPLGNYTNHPKPVFT